MASGAGEEVDDFGCSILLEFDAAMVRKALRFVVVLLAFTKLCLKGVLLLASHLNFLQHLAMFVLVERLSCIANGDDFVRVKKEYRNYECVIDPVW